MLKLFYYKNCNLIPRAYIGHTIGKVKDNIILIPNCVTDVNLEISAEIISLQKLLSHTSVTQSGKVKDNIILIPDCVTDVTLKNKC